MGLAGTIQIVGQQPKESVEGGLINPGACRHAVTLPTGCSWIEEHLEHPLPSLVHPSFGAVVWPGLMRFTAKADGTLGDIGWA